MQRKEKEKETNFHILPTDFLPLLQKPAGIGRAAGIRRGAQQTMRVKVGFCGITLLPFRLSLAKVWLQEGGMGSGVREGRWPTTKTAAVLEKEEGEGGSIYCLYVASPAHPWNFQRERGGNELGEEEKGISPYPAPAGGEGGKGSKVCLLA